MKEVNESDLSASNRDSHYDDLTKKYRWEWRKSWTRMFAVTALVLVCAYYVGLFDATRLAEGFPAIGVLISESIPPDFSAFGDWIGPLRDTVLMSLVGTAIAVAISLPLAFFGARNTTPNVAVYHVVRGVFNVLRSIPELIMGIIFVAAVGFGALSGVLALAIHSIGMLGKFFAEFIEHVRPEPVEAARAAGASDVQIIVYGIIPQVVPQVVDVILYRWEYNFRASTVMGMVGAGGIGAELVGSLRIFRYQEVSALLIIILAMVTVVDLLGSYLRKKAK